MWEHLHVTDSGLSDRMYLCIQDASLRKLAEQGSS